MISINDAITKSTKYTDYGSVEEVELKDINGGFLAEDVISKINLPSFRNSAMDGYAILHNDYELGLREFSLVGEIQAGNTKTYDLKPGETFRIFTGAPTPLNCDLVIMQEHVTRNGNKIVVEEENSKKDQNIRRIGEQVVEGNLALESGTELTSAAIGYLASLGASKIKTRPAPSIAVVTTGDELVKQGNALKFGQIYESNSYGIVQELKNSGISRITSVTLKDNYEETRNSIEELIKTQDYVILTGGISVGDYDFVGKALEELNVNEVFYKVKQKPGKPLFFGRIGKCHVFALPGNPAAALTCLHVYVKASIRKFRGSLNPDPEFISLTAENEFSKKGNRGQFLKAVNSGLGITILEGQSSNMMQTFAVSNALAYLGEDSNTISKGDRVNCILL